MNPALQNRFDDIAPMAHVRYAMGWIIDAALESTPRNGVWVEVGVGTGRGISYMARALIETGRDDITLYAVDPWAGTARCGEQSRALPEPGRHGDWALFLKMMRTHAPEELERIHILRLESYMAARAVGNTDLVIIDGDHSFHAVCDDLVHWTVGGNRRPSIVGGDDMAAGSDVERAVLEFFGGAEPPVERRGNPHSTGEQADWPTWMVRV